MENDLEVPSRVADYEITPEIISQLQSDGFEINDQSTLINSEEAKDLIHKYLKLKQSENADQEEIDTKKQELKTLVASLEVKVARGQMDTLFSRRRSSLRQDQSINETGLVGDPVEEPIAELPNETTGTTLPGAEDIFESIKNNESFRRRSSQTMKHVSSTKSREFGWRRTSRSTSSAHADPNIVKVQAKRRNTFAGNAATSTLAFNPPDFLLKEESHDDHTDANDVTMKQNTSVQDNFIDANTSESVDIESSVDTSEPPVGEHNTSDSLDWDTLLTTSSNNSLLMKRDQGVTGELLGKTSLSLRKSSSEDITQRIETEDNAEIISLLCQLREEKEIARKLHDENEHLTQQNLELETVVCDLKEERLQRLQEEGLTITQNTLIERLSETLKNLEGKVIEYNNDLELMAAGENQNSLEDVIAILEEMRLAVNEQKDGEALAKRIENIKISLDGVVKINQKNESLENEREAAKLRLKNLKETSQNVKSQINETEKNGLNAMKVNGGIIVDHEMRGKDLEKLQLELNEQLKGENESAEELRDIYLQITLKPNKILTKKMTVRSMVEIIKNELRKKDEEGSNSAEIYDDEIEKLKNDINTKEAEVQRLDEKLQEVTDNFKPVIASKNEFESKLRRLKDETNSFKQDIKASRDFSKEIEIIKMELIMDKKSDEEQMAILENCREKEKMLGEYICKREEQLKEQERIREVETNRIIELEKEFQSFMSQEQGDEVNSPKEITTEDSPKEKTTEDSSVEENGISMSDNVSSATEKQRECNEIPENENLLTLEELIISETNAERRKYVDKFIMEASELKQQIEDIRRQITGKSEIKSQNLVENNETTSKEKKQEKTELIGLISIEENIKKEYQNSIDVFRACRLENSELWMSLQQKIMQNNKLDRELDGFRRERRFEREEYPKIKSQAEENQSMYDDRLLTFSYKSTDAAPDFPDGLKLKEENESLLQEELRFSRNSETKMDDIMTGTTLNMCDDDHIFDCKNHEQNCLQPPYNEGRTCPRWSQNKSHSICQDHSQSSFCNDHDMPGSSRSPAKCHPDDIMEDHCSLKSQINAFNSPQSNRSSPGIGYNSSRDTSSIKHQRETFKRLCKNIDEIMERRKAQKRFADVRHFDTDIDNKPFRI